MSAGRLTQVVRTLEEWYDLQPAEDGQRGRTAFILPLAAESVALPASCLGTFEQVDEQFGL
jgi:hypothetical protein